MKDCIEWNRGRDKNGYGKTYRNGKHVKAHRMAFLDANGYLPPLVTHICDNPPCVNPAHLEAGTCQSNMDDKYARGRAVQVSGARHGMAKLNEYAVQWIRSSALPGTVVAEWAEVSRSQVSRIRLRQCWTEELASDSL